MRSSTQEAQRRTDSEERLARPEPSRLDVVFGVLKSSRRRRVLRYIDDESPSTISELAEHIAATENDVPRRELTSKQRKRVYVSLYQSHLPKLDEAGAVSYDQSRGTVELSPGTDEFLSFLDRGDDSAHRPAYGLAVYPLAGGVLLAAALLAAYTAAVSGNVGLLLLGSGVVGAAVFLGYRYTARWKPVVR